MPLGFERLNERQQRPNALINFIKPLDTADKVTAENFLQRIAAQCYPVMKKHHISVMSLEEYAPNPEFLGRNFNAGEVIQLVLKDRQGRWLSMKFVQMVMMHELAHCKQMNHSRFFWDVRNEYARQMEGLWQERYTGEGMWGRGRGLTDGAFVHENAPDASQIPEHLCGGSYRRRGRKRKRGQQSAESKQEKLSYAERQQRRIARKFGAHGEGATVGEDELLRGALETHNGGKRHQGKPKVAKSKRGRELRANAALARFEAAKHKPLDPQIKVEEDSETESEWEVDDSESKNIIKDEQGHDMVKVCGDEMEDDLDGAGKEMDELRQLGDHRSKHVNEPGRGVEGHDDSETESESEDMTQLTSIRAKDPQPRSPEPHQQTDAHDGSEEDESTRQAAANPFETRNDNEVNLTKGSVCRICSLENDPGSPTCMACAHVLRPRLVPDSWRCGSESCPNNQYINAGDAGRCGLCGAAKSKAIAVRNESLSRPMGITSAEVLRWD